MEHIDLNHALLLLPDWYARSARDLPWRKDREPYHVWISEIMLQQTRVEAVKAYYIRFMEVLPSIEALAACDPEKLLKLWEGLGYYSRARNLHRAARTIVSQYNGIFPDSYAEILSLSGIGPYTAGAIASIAFRIPVSAVDGNVLRVLSRLREDTRDIADTAVKKEVSNEITKCLCADPQIDPGIMNQALMELGATVCLPNGAPECEACPWTSVCRAAANGTVLQLPVKSRAQKRRIEKHTILLITDGSRLLLEKRPAEGLLASLYEPVNLTGWYDTGQVTGIVREMGLSPLRVTRGPDARHIFTHIEWEMQGYLIRIEDTAEKETCFFADRSAIRTSCAIPSAFRTYLSWLEETGIM